MANYVDGFVLPVPKKKVKAYQSMAQKAGKLWLEHGALEFHECMAEDVKDGKVTSFPMSVKLKKGEVVFFSWIIYKSRKHRDAVLKAVMTDPRMEKICTPDKMPFDAQRMVWGGFQPIVSMKAATKKPAAKKAVKKNARSK